MVLRLLLALVGKGMVERLRRSSNSKHSNRFRRGRGRRGSLRSRVPVFRRRQLRPSRSRQTKSARSSYSRNSNDNNCSTSSNSNNTFKPSRCLPTSAP